MNWLKFAAMNVMRNRRRALVTILITAVGVAGILVGGGFALYTYDSLREMAARDNGHLILAHPDHFDKQKQVPLEFGLADYPDYRRELLHDERVRAVLPRLEFSGLISNGDKSSVFLGRGIAHGEFKVKGPFLRILEGAALSSRPPEGSDPPIMIGSELAKIMNTRPGDSLTLLSTTVEGSLNAQDVVVQGIFSIGMPEIDKRILLMGVETVQELLQTDKVSTLSVYLYETDLTPTMSAELRESFPNLTTQTWRDTAFYYAAVRSLYNRIFGLLGIIILLMVFFAVANTLSMNVMERTREIGALRAIGTHPGEVVRNFILEALVMALCGVALGMVLAAGVSIFFYLADLQMPPPPARSQGYPLVVYIDYVLYMITGIGVVLLSVTAAWFTARKAANKPIVEALAHV